MIVRGAGLVAVQQPGVLVVAGLAAQIRGGLV